MTEASQFHLRLQSAVSKAGTWRLEAGQALTLVPRIDAKITATAGGLWLTLGGVSRATDRRADDIFLAQGHSLIIPSGAVAVIEAWGDHPAPAYFAWDAVVPALALPVRRVNHRTLHIVQPWHDLLQGIGMTAHAAWRLACGVLGYPWMADRLAKCMDGTAQV